MPTKQKNVRYVHARHNKLIHLIDARIKSGQKEGALPYVSLNAIPAVRLPDRLSSALTHPAVFGLA